MQSKPQNDYPEDWDSIRKRVYARDDFECQNCHRQGDYPSDLELHAHHIVPLSQGGSNKMSNLVTLCKQCHMAAHERAIAPTVETDSDDSDDGLLVEIYRAYKQYKAMKPSI